MVSPIMTGALGDTIPLDKAFADGCDKVVLILTKPAGIIRADGTDRKRHASSADATRKLPNSWPCAPTL